MNADPSRYFDPRALSDFVYDASAVPIPDPEEELRLAVAASHGDGKALDDLIRPHLRTVVDVAIALRGDVPTSQLIPAGLRGLVQAAHHFDPSHDGPFGVFARPFIRREMRAALFPELAAQD